MRKNLLIGASALAVLAFANTANAAALTGTYDADTPLPQSEANTIANGVTATIDAGYSVTLTQTIDGAAATQGTLVVNGTVDATSKAIGGTAELSALTVGADGVLTIGVASKAVTATSSGTLNLGADLTTTNLILAGGTVNQTAGTVVDGDNVAVTGDVTFNQTGGTMDTVVISADTTLTVTALGGTMGAVTGAADGAGELVFDSATDDQTFTLTAAAGTGAASLAEVAVGTGDTLVTGANNIDATAVNIMTGATVTTAAGSITGAVSNAGTLNLGAGGVTGTIDGAGAINVVDDADISGVIGGTTAVGAITVADTKTLTINGNVSAASIDGAVKDGAGAGTVAFAGNSVISGNMGAINDLLAVSIGAVTVDAETNNVSIAATAVDFTGAGTLTMGNGAITGDVTGGTGTLNLLGTGSVSGTIAAGTVNVGDGTTTNSVNINDNITAAFNVADKATAVIAADAKTITGATGVAGTLNIGSYDLTQTGTLGVTATGTLNLGTGSVAVAGNATTIATGGTLSTTVSGTSAGQITTDQSLATIAADSVLSLNVAGYVANGANITIVDTSNAAGAVNTYTTAIVDNSALVSFAQHATETNDIIVTATRASGYDDVTTGPGTAAGTALEADGAAIAAIAVGTRTAAQTSLFNVLGQVEQQATTAAVSAAVNELAPEVNGAGVEGALAAVNQVSGTVSNRMEAARGYASLGNTGVASGDEWIKGYGVWGQFFGAYAEQDLHDGIDGYEATTLGFALGGDKQFTDNLTAGVALSYANADIDSTDASAGNNTEVDSYGVSLYGTYNNGSPWYVEGQVGFAFNEYDSTRKIGFAGLTAKGDFDGMQYGAKVGAGYTYDMGSTLVTPMASLQYTRIELDSYTETGAGGASLRVNEQDYDVLTSELGAKLAVKPFEAAGWTVAPEVHAAWTYDIVKDEAEVTAVFTGGSTSFTTKGKEPSEHGLKLGFGVDVANGENVTVSVNYDAEVKEEYLGHVAALKVRYDF